MSWKSRYLSTKYIANQILKTHTHLYELNNKSLHNCPVCCYLSSNWIINLIIKFGRNWIVNNNVVIHDSGLVNIDY